MYSSKARSNNRPRTSSIKDDNSNTSIIIWILRIPLIIILVLFTMPLALLLTPWWIFMQPFERACPNMMNGYYRLVTWPLTISEKIRSYGENDRFIDQLKY